MVQPVGDTAYHPHLNILSVTIPDTMFVFSDVPILFSYQRHQNRSLPDRVGVSSLQCELHTVNLSLETDVSHFMSVTFRLRRQYLADNNASIFSNGK